MKRREGREKASLLLQLQMDKGCFLPWHKMGHLEEDEYCICENEHYPFCNAAVRTGLRYSGRQMMTHQTHYSAPVNKRQVVFLGMGVAQSDSEVQLGREVVNNLDLAFVLPPWKRNNTQIWPWCQQHPQRSLSISARQHRSQARMIHEDSFDVTDGAHRAKDDHRTPSPGLRQHRTSSQAGKGGSSGSTQLYHHIT